MRSLFQCFVLVCVVSAAYCNGYSESNLGRYDNLIFSESPLKLTTNPISTCNEDQLKDLCFWKNITFIVNPKSTKLPIESIEPPRNSSMCNVRKIQYDILTGIDLVKLLPPGKNSNKWTLSLNKEVMEKSHNLSSISANISCFIDTPDTSTYFYKSIDINFEEELCGTLQPQEKYVGLELPRKHIKKGDKVYELIFVDDVPAGKSKYESFINDSAISEFLESSCTVLPMSRNNGNGSFINCALVATRSRSITGDLNFFLVLKSSNSQCPGKSLIGYSNVVISYRPPDRKTLKKGRVFRDSKIFRTAAPYARVTQPTIKSSTGWTKFSCRAINVSQNPFKITPDEGIIYVDDTAELRNIPSEELRLNVSWLKNGSPYSEEVIVRLVTEPTITCENVTKKNDWMFCSGYSNKKSCERVDSCGIGTGGSAGYEARHSEHDKFRCVWRGDKRPENHETHLYSTCTPDKMFCPDGICDSLELLDEDSICPQDCTTRVFIPAKINGKTGRGIDICNGAVVCGDVGCTCDVIFPKIENKVVGHKLVSGRNEVAANSNCDTECILITTGGISLVTFSIIFSILIWRTIRMKKLSKDKYLENLQEAETPFSDYIERNVNTEPLVLNFQMNTNFDYSNDNPKSMQVEPKWKFSRQHIVIEQVLGEGEFGRVLRAKAFNIAGRQGYSLVAVKTLKNEARKQDYNDLFSEYQLLKEVKHPHVIQLLGVCSTEDGGPLYLIIEYASHGSLRNYLRRSRHILTTNELGHIEDNLGRHITPKEILSFARQIASGMSYLSDIKLVHRDLAARNILLAENKVCKISDFGLTRDIYEDNAYFKKSKGRVPVKWMAPESLADHLYTSKSDVWSFGVLIWELVTLGASPYPGIQVQNLYNLLQQGYRMERPPNCSTVLYSLMNRCWNVDPEARPSFLELYHCFDNLLTDNVNYLDLSDNSIINKSYFSTFAIDVYSASGDTANEKNNFLKNNLYKDRLENEDKWRNPMEGLKANCHPGYETPVKTPKPVNIFVNEASGEYTDMSAKHH
ncbi:proto-oncogene tyrosine-protein kinase receptor Ret-like [Euwallacea similis]|uniref:proto-oncogene tyrosine-protein kinase receptor Ret-like n=1 Tax=Euwallacea similis TaxID=1736056 RepID=UPI00344E6D7C